MLNYASRPPISIDTAAISAVAIIIIAVAGWGLVEGSYPDDAGPAASAQHDVVAQHHTASPGG